MPVRSARDGAVTVVTIDRPEKRNAIDEAHASALDDAILAFERDPEAHVLVLTGTNGVFSAGGDLTWLGAWDAETARRYAPETTQRAPLGPTRRVLRKPAIAAIDGYAIGGGIELALLCDLRVAARDAFFTFANRARNLPLTDGGTIRLPRLIGLGRALDLVLTGRCVDAEEAHRIGLVDRLTDPGASLPVALALARDIASLGQASLRIDRFALLDGAGNELRDALDREYGRAARFFQPARLQSN